MELKRTDNYEDILYLPHHVSKKRKRMSLHDRAAQFAPFAALTGHDAAVKETARLTEAKIELDEHEIERVNQKLQYILQNLSNHPETIITYFLPDEKKSGGKYVETDIKVKKYDEREHSVILEDGTSIPVINIFRINLERNA